ncbi:hypothetical protein AQZ52_09735 [Novosphingobium fuchskuhlense]|uniref:Uncharacterized protein n=1 Tax=Novosphingobium fuchskuhlense TaxID=1117702 RepID=A0A117UVX4_9SPHN|nr:hypothetical protein [Novosphingobium fuchskuhlense]KUR71851.1 hypothetical protein AQZ52_09735 [Novosphingobium fuchskuhlense]
MKAEGRGTAIEVSLNSQRASLSLQLDSGTEFINDADGDTDLYIGLLEVAQNVCEAIWRGE